MKKEIEYLLQKVRSPKTNQKNHPSQDELFPAVHGAGNNGVTFCGKVTMDGSWYISQANFEWNPIKKEQITCKACLKMLK